VRESIGWRLCEDAPGHWDLSRAVRMAQAAQRQGVQILWTVMHYGVPPDLTLLDDALIDRFAAFAGEVARVLKPLCPGPRIYTPINEISFLSWAASATGDMGPAGLLAQGAPEDSSISGYRLKQRLVRACLAGMAAMRRVDPEARFLHVEPVVHVTASSDDPEQRALARRIASFQWQALDMLAGRIDPGLGGHEQALDWLGLNHYHSSQWEVPSEKRLAWHLRDPRRLPLSALLGDVWRRYRRPLVIAETGHIGVGRAAWLHEMAGEALRARAAGVPLHGVCLYPLLDRPDWNDSTRWHRSGLWHLPRTEPGAPPQPQRRSLNRPFARALLAWRNHPSPEPPPPAAEQRPGMLVLLPCAWEDWRAPREALLTTLAQGRPVHLLEPPRSAPGLAEPLLRHHAVSPGAELLVLHRPGVPTAGWAVAPTAAELALLRGALQGATPRPWVCWLAGWRADGHPAWWRELSGLGLILQPDPVAPPQGELLRRARRLLPATWPEPALARRPHAASYEAEEAEALLRHIPAPLWLLAPPSSVDASARRLRELAARHPHRHLLVDAPAPAASEPWPANLHWLGGVHDSLHAALAARVDRVLPWTGTPGWPALDGMPRATPAAPTPTTVSGHRDAANAQQRPEVVDGALQALFEADLGLPAQQRAGA
jgi:hypothetical protein